MIIIGIDPGSRLTGYGVIECQKSKYHYIDSGCIRIDPQLSIQKRLQTIFEGVDQLIGLYHPNIMSIEKVFMATNPAAALKLGQARGVALSAAGMANLEVFEYSPTTVKKTIVGSGHADKIQVQHMVIQLLKLNKTPQADAADALAIALCHALHARFTF